MTTAPPERNRIAEFREDRMPPESSPQEIPLSPSNRQHDGLVQSPWGGDVIDAPVAVDFSHRLRFSQDVLNPRNPTLRDAMDRDTLRERARAIVCIDQGLVDAGNRVIERTQKYFDHHNEALELMTGPMIVPGGEQAKNDYGVYQRVLEAIHEFGICRHSYVVVIGGGAVLDAVGFAAAIAHRGVRLVRLPTTTLAQDDSGVGVKCGINAFNKKNFLGTFSVPWAVINDIDFLATLSDRDWRSGFSEAVKVALLKDAGFYELIERRAPRLTRRDLSAAAPIIRRSAELHLDHIVRGGDPFELTLARPLDFGHWAAHKLEQMTGFELRHGEAVAIGLAIDLLYSVEIGLLDARAAQRIIGCLRDLGFELSHPALKDVDVLLTGLQEFREHLGGRLTIPLLRGIGRPTEVHEIDEAAMVRAIASVARLDDEDAASRAAG